MSRDSRPKAVEEGGGVGGLEVGDLGGGAGGDGDGDVGELGFAVEGGLGEGQPGVIRFAAPEFGVAPGQAAVLYAGERVVGGGWIESTQGVA